MVGDMGSIAVVPTAAAWLHVGRPTSAMSTCTAATQVSHMESAEHKLYLCLKRIERYRRHGEGTQACPLAPHASVFTSMTEADRLVSPV